MNSTVANLALLGQAFEQHRPRLEAMIERRMDPALRARVDGKDIVQDAFARARTRWSEFQSQQRGADTGVYAWLYRQALDALIEVWRRNNRGPRDVRREMRLPEESSVQAGCGLIVSGPGPVTQLQQDELRAMVRQVMMQLKESDRELLWMRHTDQLTHEEIADVLGITTNAAMVRYARALRRFKEFWDSGPGGVVSR